MIVATLPLLALLAGDAPMRGKLCEATRPLDRGALLKREDRVTRVARGRGTEVVEALFDLGCTRMLLAEADAIAREGYLLPLGESWRAGAINAFLALLEREPSHAAAATLVAETALGDWERDRDGRIVRALGRAVAAGVRTPWALRGCTEYAARGHDALTGRRCAAEALRLGLDSTFHFLRLAQYATQEGDTAAVQTHFRAATAAATDSAARAELGWHLQWFLTPEELAEWEAIPLVGMGAFVMDRLAARDTRDGRAPGTRLAEHFVRFEYALTHFRLDYAKVIRTRGGVIGANPENPLPPESAAWAKIPALVPAAPIRWYARHQVLLDDRGAVWMRFGAPLRRSFEAPSADMIRPHIKMPEVIANTREGWLYEIDGRHLLLSFEGEQFDGTVEAARLVAGVLGFYLCDLGDARRCLLTERASAAGYGAGAAVQAERMAELRQDDAAAIANATTRDDNSIRGRPPLGLTAQRYRLWDAARGLVAVTGWSVPLADLRRPAADTGAVALELTLRQWDRAAAAATDTTITRRARLPAAPGREERMTGAFLAPTGGGGGTWALHAAVPTGATGRVWEDVEGFGGAAGRVALSDLVIGAPDQGVTATVGGERVVLAPLGVLDRTRDATLFYQIRNDVRRTGVKTVLALRRIEAHRDQTPELRFEFTGLVEAGTSAVHRGLDLSALSGSAYRIEILLEDAAGILARRDAVIRLR